MLHLSNINRREAYRKIFLLCGNHRQMDLVCECINEFSDFSQDIRALPEACTSTEPAGEIRGGF